ncbi:molybdate ABC transporter substrate-binding protein [Lentibacillus kapialis]|uniref:molybdate ABC transporter substrate-binding protein n=1 Tax=Lentibacillus kapialis TaxID=340214 RepID=UPI001E5C878D|nr:molybdate ABC transporter substrate-binding protein [Lentibacillus kapialis]
MTIVLSLLIVSILITGCNRDSSSSTDSNAENDQDPEKNAELMISSASSLTDALNEIKTSYEKEHDVDLTINFGGSGSLAQQIQQGAPADVFISANQDWMDTLEDEQLIFPKTRSDVTGNKMALIANKSSDLNYQSIRDMAAEDLDVVTIGDPESVPAGKYAKQTLKTLNMWDNLKHQLVLAKNVRQVLTYVETGNADIGFVYQSDAMISDKIQVLAKAGKDMHDPITYPAAVVKDTEQKMTAKEFINYIESDQAQTILKKYGFKKTD